MNSQVVIASAILAVAIVVSVCIHEYVSPFQTCLRTGAVSSYGCVIAVSGQK